MALAPLARTLVLSENSLGGAPSVAVSVPDRSTSLSPDTTPTLYPAVTFSSDFTGTNHTLMLTIL